MFRKNIFTGLLLVALAVFACSCRSSYDVARADQQEGTIIFTRNASYTMFFGTYSKRDLIEITYEKASRNEAGLLQVEVGIRYRGPVSWTDWFRTAPKFLTLNSRCRFMSSANGPDLYSTNTRAIHLRLGEVYSYKAVCPVERATAYQLILGE